MNRLKKWLAPLLAVVALGVAAPVASAVPSANAAYWQCVGETHADAAAHLFGGVANNGMMTDTTVSGSVRYVRMLWSNDYVGSNPFTWESRGVLSLHYDCSYEGSDRNPNDPTAGAAYSSGYHAPAFGYGPSGYGFGTTGHPDGGGVYGPATGTWAYPYGKYYP